MSDCTFMDKIALAKEVRAAMRKHRRGKPVAFQPHRYPARPRSVGRGDKEQA